MHFTRHPKFVPRLGEGVVLAGEVLPHRISSQLGPFPTQLRHEVLLHGFSQRFNGHGRRLFQLSLKVAKGPFPAGSCSIVGLLLFATTRGSRSGKGQGAHGEGQTKGPRGPCRSRPGVEVTWSSEDVTHVLVQDLDVLLVREGHAR